MLNITDKCTGCRACEQICAHKAIEFRQDREGFWSPVINQSRCIDCGLCAKKCPQNQSSAYLFMQTERAIAARLKDDSILYKSASGGAFAGIAMNAIQSGWIVFGVMFDDNLVAHHGKAEKIEELYALLSSKYVQSDTRHTFNEVRTLLKEGKSVLYSGTGCQIAGLKAFLGKEYDNLVTIDLVCHGVPSPLLFKYYIETLSHEHGGCKISDFDFRDKKIGWGLDYRYRHNNKYTYKSCSESPYYSNFLKGTIYRECCYSCRYARKERVADITVADYWGIEYVHPEFEDERGVSLVLINSSKGHDLWKRAESSFVSINTDLNEAAKYNGNLSAPTHRDASIRDHIYDGIQEMDAEVFIKTRLPYRRTLRSRIKSILPVWALRLARKYLK